MKYGELYNKIQKLADKLIQKKDNYSVVSDIACQYDAIKYQVINELTILEDELNAIKTKEIDDIIADESKKKIVNSSTLTKTYIDGRIGSIQSKYNGLNRLWSGLKSSLDLCRSLLSGIKYEAQI